jgi:2-hydroxy-3-keto-5-methylthiopentenyl-1-phosphate phosphatase
MLIVCDFDGTVTVEDVSDLIWNDFYDGNWREDLLPAYEAGRVSTLELMNGGYGKIDRSPEHLLDHLRGKVNLRAGFLRLAEHARERGWRIHVASCGLEFYIRALLPPGISYDCYIGEFEKVWRVRLPAGMTLAPGEDFKVSVLERLRAGRERERSVYVGDGRNDLSAAATCDHVFAVEGSELAELCRKAGLPFASFSRFDEILTALSGEGLQEPVL